MMGAVWRLRQLKKMQRIEQGQMEASRIVFTPAILSGNGSGSIGVRKKWAGRERNTSSADFAADRWTDARRGSRNLTVDEHGYGTGRAAICYQLIRQPKPIVGSTIRIEFLGSGVGCGVKVRMIQMSKPSQASPARLSRRRHAAAQCAGLGVNQLPNPLEYCERYGLSSKSYFARTRLTALSSLACRHTTNFLHYQAPFADLGHLRDK